MAVINEYGRVQLLHDTKARFTQYNPILMDGEIGLERQPDGTTYYIKIGDGVTPWLALSYFGSSNVSMEIDDNNHLIFINSTGERTDVGDLSASVDLSNYYKKSEVDTLLNAKSDGSYNNSVSGLSSTTVKGAIDELASGKVDKSGNKVLSDNNYTTTEKNKLAGIAANANNYTHPSYTPKTSGLYNIAVDATGHVSATTAVTKADITALGIVDGNDNTIFRLKKLATAEDNNLATYVLQQKATGSSEYTDVTGSDKINIPKDVFFKSGLVKTVTTANSPVSGYVVGDKYIEITLNNDSKLYIKVSDLVDTSYDNSVSGLSATTVKGAIDELASGKVSKDGTKVLSDNNYTTTEKNKLAGIAANAEVNQNAFTTVKVGTTNLVADSKTDTLTITAGSNITLTPTASSDSFTIAAKDTTYEDATQETHGLMSVSDKTKLDGVAANANNYTHPSYTAKASGLYNITVDTTGHVSATTAVTKENILNLGILENVENELVGLNNVYSSYNDTTNEYNLESFFRLSRTGEIYGTQFYNPTFNPSTISWRLESSIGKVCVPSTATVRNRNDFENIPLFRSYDVNAYIDENDNYHVTAIKGDSRFRSDGSNGDVFVMVMAGFVRYEKYSNIWRIYYSDTHYSGYMPLPGSRRLDGTLRPFMLYAKYNANTNPSTNVIASVSNRHPILGLTYQEYIDYMALRTSSYTFKTNCDDFYIKLMLWIKYATTLSSTVFKGCTAYNIQAPITVATTNANYVVISKENASKLLVGSIISISNSTDRTASLTTSILNRARIKTIESHDDNNARLIIDFNSVAVGSTTSVTTTTSSTVSTMPYMSGWCDDVLGSDGSRIDYLSGKEPFKISGIEIMNGAYEIMSNQVGKRTYNSTASTDTLEMLYVNDHSKLSKTASDITVANGWKLHSSVLDLTTMSGGTWSYIQDMSVPASAMHAQTPLNIGGSSSIGTGNGLRISDTPSSGIYTWRTYGGLSTGTYAGVSCISLEHALASSAPKTWISGTRLSATGKCDIR